MAEASGDPPSGDSAAAAAAPVVASPPATDAGAAGAEAEAAAAESWRGALPCVFCLAADEVATLRPPRPYCICLPRQSLLPLAADVVRRHFEPFAPPMGSSNLWFEASGQPLRWQLPIGVLFDLLCGEEAAVRHELPWRITVHFASFPANQVLRATVREAESVLMNALKEACFLRCGSAMPAMQLDAASQTALLTALANATNPDAAYRSYRQVANQIEATVAAHREREMRDKARAASFRVPFRACVSPSEWRQAPMPVVWPATARPTTLSEALAALLPGMFGGAEGAGKGADGGGAGASSGGGGGGGGGAAAGGGEEGGGAGEEAAASGASGDDVANRGECSGVPVVLVQGVAVPLTVRLDWLWEACSHPDGWLYACVVRTPGDDDARAGEPVIT